MEELESSSSNFIDSNNKYVCCVVLNGSLLCRKPRKLAQVKRFIVSIGHEMLPGFMGSRKHQE